MDFRDRHRPWFYSEHPVNYVSLDTCLKTPNGGMIIKVNYLTPTSSRLPRRQIATREHFIGINPACWSPFSLVWFFRHLHLEFWNLRYPRGPTVSVVWSAQEQHPSQWVSVQTKEEHIIGHNSWHRVSGSVDASYNDHDFHDFLPDQHIQ